MTATLSVRNALLLFLLFLLVCLGLGYPIVNRYDPGKIPGISDAAGYCDEVRDPLNIASYRPFVPALAKPFYWLAQGGRIGSWDPARFGMLVSTSILSAATAIVIVLIGLRSGFSYLISLLASMLFLMDFAVPNWNLSAYVDSGESLFMALTVWSLLSHRWYLLPVWSFPGALSKETFAPFAFVFALTWWVADRPLRLNRLVWIGAIGALGCAAVLLSFSPAGAMTYARDMAAGYRSVGLFTSLLHNLSAREFFYTFIWLLPLSIPRLSSIDRRWLWATAATLLLALLLGAYNNALGNTTRAFFNIAGPMFSLSAALFLAELTSRSAKPVVT